MTSNQHDSREDRPRNQSPSGPRNALAQSRKVQLQCDQENVKDRADLRQNSQDRQRFLWKKSGIKLRCCLSQQTWPKQNPPDHFSDNLSQAKSRKNPTHHTRQRQNQRDLRQQGENYALTGHMSLPNNVSIARNSAYGRIGQVKCEISNRKMWL